MSRASLFKIKITLNVGTYVLVITGKIKIVFIHKKIEYRCYNTLTVTYKPYNNCNL